MSLPRLEGGLEPFDGSDPRTFPSGFNEVAEAVEDLQAIAGDAYRLNVEDYGAVGDGATDDHAAIQEALDDALDGEVIFPTPSAVYRVSEPIVVADRRTISVAPEVTIEPTDGFVGEAVVMSTWDNAGFWWHRSKITDLRVNCRDQDISGVAIYQMGEESVLRRVRVSNAGRSGFLLTGVHAVGTIEACSAWGCDDYGLKFTEHLSANGGSCRVFGFSGDDNGPGLIYLDGWQQLELLGIKYEGQRSGDPGPVVIGGAGTGSDRARITLSGRFEGSLQPGSGAIVTIQDTARPSVVLLPSHGAGWEYVIDDEVTGETLEGSNPPGLLFWGKASNDEFVIESETNLVKATEDEELWVGPGVVEPGNATFTGLSDLRRVIQFSGSATNHAQFVAPRIPSHWSTFDIELWWTNAESSGSGDDAVWNLGDTSVDEGGNGSTSFSGFGDAIGTADGQHVVVVTTLAVGATKPDGVGTYRIQRRGADSSDTLSSNAHLYAIRFVRTS